jgi:hypothetical protein
MTPSLMGRWQTRIFTLAVIGSIWTLLITPIARLTLDGSPPLGTVYKVTFKALIIVAVAGLGWDVIYQFLMAFRWEKDWPALFGFATIVNEGITTFIGLHLFSFLVPARGGVPGLFFLIDFATTYIVAWLWVTGPMRVVFLRWRFRSGRLI